MSKPERCPRCATLLAPNAPEGLCPACLMEQGLETGPAPDRRGTMGRFTPPRPDELAPLFPQLELLELIGRGGMGAVYKARQRGLDRIVALKILPPEVGRDRAFAERFTREAKALARLNHPNIVAVHDVGRAGEYYFFVMEFVDGLNLRETLLAGKLTPPEAMAIVPQICDALQYAHDEGIVHRDIKPENILLDRRGRVKIADFGLAKLMGLAPTDLTLTQEQQVMGTPRYMAPEQIERSSAVDHRADIYSLGVVFYEMLTGELPLGRFAPPSKKVQIDVRLDEVVLRSLEKEPERRFQKVSEFKTSVETIASSPREPVAPPHDREHRHGFHHHGRYGEHRPSHAGVLWVVMALLIAMMTCCLPLGLGIFVMLAYWGTYEEPLAQPAAEQPGEFMFPPPEARIAPPPPPPEAPRALKPAAWRKLEFRIVPNIGDEAKPPRLSQAEFDDLQGQVETYGIEAWKSWEFTWIELSADVDAGELPVAVVNETKYLLLSTAGGSMLQAAPLRVAAVAASDSEDNAAVEIELTAEDGRRMEALTSANLGNRMAVVAGNRVISVATIRSTIGSKGQITGNKLRSVAARLVEQLRLDAPAPENDQRDSSDERR